MSRLVGDLILLAKTRPARLPRARRRSTSPRSRPRAAGQGPRPRRPRLAARRRRGRRPSPRRAAHHPGGAAARRQRRQAHRRRRHDRDRLRRSTAAPLRLWVRDTGPGVPTDRPRRASSSGSAAATSAPATRASGWACRSSRAIARGPRRHRRASSDADPAGRPLRDHPARTDAEEAAPWPDPDRRGRGADRVLRRQGPARRGPPADGRRRRPGGPRRGALGRASTWWCSTSACPAWTASRCSTSCAPRAAGCR